jgi:inosine-uridine nucleoside N-ribohydrolase
VKRVILDTDVGTDVDDALAIALATASREIELEGITTYHSWADIFQDGRTYMHDPLAVYCAACSRHVSMRRMHVALEVRDRVPRTISYPDRPPNMRVCVDVDAPAFVNHWLHRVRRLTARVAKQGGG